MIHRPFYLDRIQAYLDKPIVKVITGMRRVGKSTLLTQVREGLLAKGIPESQILSINKDLVSWDGIRDVDFVAERHGERLYIQVAYLLAGPETIAREFGNLERIPDNHPKLVLSMDELGPDQRHGIRRQHLVAFLLEAEA